MKIEAVRGDIASMATEAVVNAANNHLWMGSGVAGALKRAGGAEIEAEAVKKGPVRVGEAVATTGGKLKARYVIHAAVMGQDLQTDAGNIREATRNSLSRAEELGIKSLAFPALGTGVGGFPVAECARIMIDEVRRHHVGTLEQVIFVLYDQSAYQAFRKELSRPDIVG